MSHDHLVVDADSPEVPPRSWEPSPVPVAAFMERLPGPWLHHYRHCMSLREALAESGTDGHPRRSEPWHRIPSGAGYCFGRVEPGMLPWSQVRSRHGVGILVVQAYRRWSNWSEWPKLIWGNCVRLMYVFGGGVFQST
jgi:hypothetical protein